MTPLPDSPLLWLALSCSLSSLFAFVINLFWYRAPRRTLAAGNVGSISILIPARNEEGGIVAAIESVLASTGITFELLVLDDASTDNTAMLVEQIAQRDGRLQLHSAPPLPPGWNGKQHACATLARLARYDRFCFLDADVRLHPQALATLLREFEARHCDLISGFPREETGTWLEKLLLPLIHFVLLCYLPIPFSRAWPRMPALAAGCGQLLLVGRRGYEASGGHAAIRETMHDGLLLPRQLRQHGFATDIVDLTALASCRMYHNATEVWNGLSKNATEGMAAPARIVPFTFLLFFGQVLPVLWLGGALLRHAPIAWPVVAVCASYIVRAIAVWRFQQSIFGALLHPISVATLLALQWLALGRKLLGRQAVWKHRTYDVG